MSRRSNLIGKTITDVRVMTDAEMRAEGWCRRDRVVQLVLDDGTRLFAAQDEEGNGPGCLFGVSPKGATFCLFLSC